MKKLAATITALILATTMWAQPPGPVPGERTPGPDFEKMKVVLDLTDEQVSQWKELHRQREEERLARMEEIRGEQQARKEEMKAEREAIRAAHDTELRKILTEEQFVKLDAMRPEQPGPNGSMDFPGNQRQIKAPAGKQFDKSDCYHNHKQQKNQQGKGE